MTEKSEKPQKLLLHACCGPCSIEPVKVLRARGIEPALFYANSNIAPTAEYEHRRDVCAQWAQASGLQFTEGPYTPTAWEQTAGRIGHQNRQARCRACYRQRFEASAAHAAAAGFDALGTTLSVSPYQYTQVIKEELERACKMTGVRPFFEDYSPHYAQSVVDSRALGMYRQNYCGCRFSAEEAARDRQAARDRRQAERAAREAEMAPIRAREEAKAAARRAQRAEYDAKQAKKRAVLKALRQQNKQQ